MDAFSGIFTNEQSIDFNYIIPYWIVVFHDVFDGLEVVLPLKDNEDETRMIN